jgi:transcriptional regulator with XRE-family HTH domain
MPYKCRKEFGIHVIKGKNAILTFGLLFKPQKMKQPELGAYITTLRNNKGLTQKELAEQCNVDIRTIQRIENGDVVPRMYTVNLLSKALDAEINVSANANTEIVIDEKFIQHMRFSWIWGIVFSVNYVGVVYNIITHSSTLFSKLGIIVNIAGYILFSKGFYHLGKKYNNRVLAISTLLSMVLVAYINMIYFLPTLFIYYFQVYILMCACAIFVAIGMIIQGNKPTNTSRFNLYNIAGVVGIIQSLMFLTFDFKIQSAGLVISAFCNLIAIAILYNQYRGDEKITLKTKGGLLLS